MLIRDVLAALQGMPRDMNVIVRVVSRIDSKQSSLVILKDIVLVRKLTGDGLESEVEVVTE